MTKMTFNPNGHSEKDMFELIGATENCLMPLEYNGAFYNTRRSIDPNCISTIELWFRRPEAPKKEGKQPLGFIGGLDDPLMTFYISEDEKEILVECTNKVGHDVPDVIPITGDLNDYQYLNIQIKPGRVMISLNGGDFLLGWSLNQPHFSSELVEIGRFLQSQSSSIYHGVVRIWSGVEDVSKDDLYKTAFESFGEIPSALGDSDFVDWQNVGLIACVHGGVYQGLFHGTIKTIDGEVISNNIALAPFGYKPEVMPGHFGSENIPLHEISGPGNYNLSDINVIDFWIKPEVENNGKFNSQCLFEFADGKEVGNLFGVYTSEIQNTTVWDWAAMFDDEEDMVDRPDQDLLGVTLDIRFPRDFHSPNFFGLFLPQNRLSYVAIVLYHDSSSGSYGYQVYINGVSMPGGNNFDSDAHLDDFKLRYMSVKESFQGDKKSKSILIGPRMWSNSEISDDNYRAQLPDHMAAYAFADFQSLNVFGALERQADIYGRLRGLVTTDYNDKAKANQPLFYLLDHRTKHISFLPNGIQFEQAKTDQVYNSIFPPEEVVSTLDLGQITYPFPLREWVKGHPVNMKLSDISTVDLWVAFRDIAASADLQMLFHIDGKDLDNGAYASFGVAFDSVKNKLVVRKDFKTTPNQMIEVLDLPGTIEDFNHLCFELTNPKGNGNLNIRFNGNEAVVGSPGIFSKFDFDIETIYVASSAEGDQRLTAEMCGPRFWNGELFDEASMHAVPFISYKLGLSALKLRNQKEIGKIDQLVITQEKFDEASEFLKITDQLWPDLSDSPLEQKVDLKELESYIGETEKNGVEMRNYKVPRSMPFEELEQLAGPWVLASSERLIPELHSDLRFEGKELPRERHCYYEPSTYIAISVDEDSHEICLLLDSNEMLEYLFSTTQFAFFGRKPKGKDLEVVCKIEFRPPRLIPEELDHDDIASLPKTLNVILIGENEGHLKAGQYKKPYRKPVWGVGQKSTGFSNIFLQRPSNFDSVLMGVDITKVDPAQYFDYEGTTGNPIFRLPPISSAWFDLHQGIAIPFGWNYIPFVSYYGDTHSLLTSNSSDLEKSTTNSIMHKNSFDNTMKGSGGLTGVFATKFSLELGFSSESNKETAKRTKRMKEHNSMSSHQEWFCTSHDIVLDKANAMFDGQYFKEDNKDDFDFNKGFYIDVMDMKENILQNKDKKHDYLNFIKRYGSHFPSSIRFGSKGWRIHQMHEDVVGHLVNNQKTVEFENTSKVGVGGGVSGGVDGFSGSFEDQVKLSNTNGSKVSDGDIKDFKNSLKKDFEESGSRGAYHEGTVDHLGEIHVFKYLEPIYELFAPPFFSDKVICTKLHERVKKAYDGYVKDYQKEVAKLAPEYTKQYKRVKIEIQLKIDLMTLAADFAAKKASYDISERKGTSLDKIDFQGSLVVGTGGESRTIRLNNKDGQLSFNKKYDPFYIIEKTLVYSDGKVQPDKVNDVFVWSYSSHLNYNAVINYKHENPWYWPDHEWSETINETKGDISEGGFEKMDFTKVAAVNIPMSIGQITVTQELVTV